MLMCNNGMMVNMIVDPHPYTAASNTQLGGTLAGACVSPATQAQQHMMQQQKHGHWLPQHSPMHNRSYASKRCSWHCSAVLPHVLSVHTAGIRRCAQKQQAYLPKVPLCTSSCNVLSLAQALEGPKLNTKTSHMSITDCGLSVCGQKSRLQPPEAFLWAWNDAIPPLLYML